MGKAETFIALAVAFAGVAGACGGKVVFVAQGSGGAGGAASTTTISTTQSTATSFGPTSTTSVGTCMTCDCMPGGCTDAETSVATSGVGGGPGNCAMTCADVLTDGTDLCADAPAAASMAFDELATCICDPTECGGPSGACMSTCAMMVENNPNCPGCEMKAIANGCQMQVIDCSNN